MQEFLPLCSYIKITRFDKSWRPGKGFH